MVTIHVVNIDGKATLPIRGDGKTESLAAGYDVVAIDDPTIVGVVSRILKLEDGTEIPLYKSVDYLEYHTALKVQPLHNNYGEYHHIDLHPRSSVRKYNLVLANSVGLIDNDYRGEILVSFKYLFQPEDFVMETVDTTPEGVIDKTYEFTGKLVGGINWTKVYRKGDKIGQLVAEKTNPINFTFVSELTATARGEGGHGSTGQQAVPQESAGGLADLYNKAGGIPVKKRYIDQVKEREYLADSAPHSNQPQLPTGIRERRP